MILWFRGMLLCFLISGSFAQDVDFITIEGGSFAMGGPGYGQTPHTVTVQSFRMARYPVTYAEYRVFLEDTKTRPPLAPPGGWVDNAPVTGVDYPAANAYCKWLSKKLGIDIRLPTEAEWEYAARGGNSPDGQVFAGGSSLSEVGWPGAGKPQGIGQRKPNALGLHDMSGHIWQWTQDWYDGDFYTRGNKNNPRNAKQYTKNRVLRGGSFDYATPVGAVYYRYFNHPENPRHDTGFRVVTGGAFKGNL